MNETATARVQIDAILAEIERLWEHPNARQFGQREDREALEIVRRIQEKVVLKQIEQAELVTAPPE